MVGNREYRHRMGGQCVIIRNHLKEISRAYRYF